MSELDDVTPVADHADVAARLRVVITRLARQLRQDSPGGLTLSQWSALATIEKHAPLRIGDLADREAFSAPTATRLVASLEEAELVARTGDPQDRRTSYIALTESGREKLEWARTVREASIAKRLLALDGVDLAQLVRTLPLLESLITEE